MLTVPTRNPIRSVTRSPLGVPGWVGRAAGTRALWDANWAAGRFYYDGMEYANHDEFLIAIGGTFARASTGTYFDSNGLLQTAASGALRFDHDPTTKAALGILPEGERENLLLQSEDAGTTWLAESAISILTDQVTAPDGNTTADKIKAGGTPSRIAQTATVSDGAQVVLSAFVKNIDATTSWLYVRDTEIRVQIEINWTGAVLTSLTETIGTGDFKDVGNGWYRVWAEGSLIAGQTSAICRYYPSTADGNKSIYIWGMQLEQEVSFPSSYIKTTTTAVTRAADSYTIGPTGGVPFTGWNASAGTVVITASVTALDAWQNFTTIDDNTLDQNRHSIQMNSSNIGIASTQDATVTQASLAEGAIVADTNTKLAYAFKENDFAFSHDGGTVQTDASGSLPTVTMQRLGAANNAGSNQLFGHISRLTYFPSRISNADLQVLTA